MNLETILSISCAALSLTAVVLLAFLLLRRKHEAFRDIDVAQRLDLAIHRLDEKLHATNVLTAEELAPIAAGVANVRGGIESLSRLVERVVAAPSPTPNDPVALEHQILAESWRQFRADHERSSALDDALQDRAWNQLIDQLAGAVPPDLEATFETVIGPCREHRTLLQRIALIPRVINGTFPRLATDAEEVRRTRDLANLLTSEAERLDFRFKSWITDTFLPFADLYLQRHQQAQLDDRDDGLQRGASLVRHVLRIAGVEPIDVLPGQTPFDSTRHIGRSTTNDPRFADGVITGVVRNGFIEGGQQVIRQPEVIVNRMR